MILLHGLADAIKHTDHLGVRPKAGSSQKRRKFGSRKLLECAVRNADISLEIGAADFRVPSSESEAHSRDFAFKSSTRILARRGDHGGKHLLGIFLREPELLRRSGKAFELSFC